MNTPELLQRIDTINAADRELCEKKNADYGAKADPLSNLREFGFFGVVVRLSDKFARLKNFVKNGAYQVKDESVRDTLQDIRIYGALAEILLDDEEVGTKVPKMGTVE